MITNGRERRIRVGPCGKQRFSDKATPDWARPLTKTTCYLVCMKRRWVLAQSSVWLFTEMLFPTWVWMCVKIIVANKKVALSPLGRNGYEKRR